MEDKTPPATTPPPAARTAEALRELHDRARTALAAQRERMGRLEAHLTQQLDSIADTLAEQIASRSDQADPVQHSDVDVEHLRQELDQARAAWDAEREQLAAEAANRTRLLDERQAELDDQAAQLASSRGNIDARQQTLDDRATDLNHRDRELRQHHELLDAYAKQCADQQSRLTEMESTLEKQREVLAEREAAVQSSQVKLDHDRDGIAAREQAWQKDQASLAAEREAFHTERETLQSEREAIHAERESLDAERDALSEKLDSLTTASQSTGDELKSQLASVEGQLKAERAAWDKERGNVEEQRRLLAKERDELTAALAAASTKLESAREQAGAAGERDELRQKFGLAIEDVQRLRGRVAELEQELVSRPAPDQTDSVELVHLRSERDAMAERIAELEQRPATSVDADAAQETADLQRRFELAVEDVRDLKKQISQLEAQLAASKSLAPSESSAAGDGGSWEAMKKQMLASLEGEGDDVDEDRHVERTTIESTIRITDEAMTHKDHEIAELKARLAEGVITAADDSKAERQLVDADSVIQGHRARIAKLESEMQDKLRAAELELSVERAKIAREQSQLATLRAELDSRHSMGDGGATAGDHLPKRRWLSKLGLGGEEDAS